MNNLVVWYLLAFLVGMAAGLLGRWLWGEE